MTSGTRDDREMGPRDLIKLIAGSGRAPSPRIEDFTRLAAAVQLERNADGASNTRSISRSTALWALMQLDGDIAAALGRAGVDQAELGRVLAVRANPGQMTPTDRRLHQDFADAVRVHLSRRPDRPEIDLVDLAIAIVTAARDGTGGLLPGRMRDLAVDYDVLLARLNQLVSARGGSEPAQLADFSGSVRGARRRLGPGASVSAADIGIALQAMHPEYGDGSFAKISFTPSEGRASVDSWLDRVHRRYDMNDVARSKHQVIDGELTLLALAGLDAQFARDLSAGGFLADLQSRAGVRPRQGAQDITQLTPDDPAERDLLGREPFAVALVGLLKTLADRGDRSNNSFLIHIDGPWGAGKSSILLFLKRKLRKDGGFLVVEVNAWREQRIGVPWWTILCALRRAVADDRNWAGKLLVWLGDLRYRLRAGWVPLAAAGLILVAILIGSLVIADLDLDSGGKAADSLAKIISLFSVVVGGLIAAVRFFLPNSRKSAQSAVDSSDSPMDEVRELFAVALGRAKKTVVFLIDDLDRCEAPYVVEFLEVMQTVVRKARPGAGPYAFVAADGDWIRSSYQEHYGSFVATSTAGRPLGYVFLEKIFQLRFRLPVITRTAKEAFFATLLTPRLDEPPRSAETPQASAVRTALRDAESAAEVATAVEGVREIPDPRARMDLLGAAAIKLSQQEIQKETEHRLKRYSRYLEANPRSMILFVNTYNILQMLRIIEERAVDPKPLALWTLIEIRWPHLADYLRRNPGAVEHRPASADGVDDIQRLILTKEVAAILDDQSLGGPLTAELVGRCAGSSDVGDPP